MVKSILLFLILSITKLSVAQPSQEFEVLSHRNGSVRSGCPEMSEIPRVDHDYSDFIGGRMYDLYGNCVPGLSCNGKYVDVLNGLQHSADPGYCAPIGSLFVNAGCTIHAFEEYQFQGSVKTFEGPLFVTKMPDGIFWGSVSGTTRVPCVNSLLVDCRQHYPDCSPSDRLEKVASFDNSNSRLPAKFTYTYQVGTSWSHEMSEDMDIDTTIEAEISFGFFHQFETRLGVSTTTHHNWNEVSSEVKNEVKTISIEIEVPGGSKMEIQQVVGSCGGSTVYTLDTR